jgi:hypothetical protein
MTMGTFARSKKPEGDSVGKATAPFPKEKAVMSIYSGSALHESCRKLKLISWAINVVGAAVLEYLHWSESPITFDRMDHSDRIPKPGRFPLIVDPLVGTTRLTKALMDGDSSLNLMYLGTFEGLGLACDHSKAALTHSMGLFRASNQSLSTGSLCRPPSKMRVTTAPRRLRSR